MEPSKKSQGINDFLQKAFKMDRRDSIEEDMCLPPPLGCGKPATEFRDEVSRREYAITGMCQKCQDRIFGQEA
jgi:hypothetical protein